MTVLAMEIGPKRFAVAEVVPADEPFGEMREIPVPAKKAWAECREMVLDVAAGRPVTSVGIASSGPLDMSAGVVAPPEIPDWRAGFPLVDSLRELFPDAKVSLAVDGACLAMAEQCFGKSRDVPDSMAIHLSDRVFGGVVIGGFTLVGRTGNAGQIGHVPVPGFDERCRCGSRGCLEAVAGTGAMLQWARQQGFSGDTIQNVIDAGELGEPVAEAALQRAGTAIGRAIASAATLLDLDRVVLSGPLAQAGPALWNAIRAAIATQARLNFLPGLRPVASELGDIALLAGAGALALLSEAAAESETND